MSYHSRQPTVAPIVVPDLLPSVSDREPRAIDVFADVPALVSVIAGRAEMTLSQLRDLAIGDVVELDRSPDATVDVYVNGTHIGRGDVIVLDETIAARITGLELTAQQEH